MPAGDREIVRRTMWAWRQQTGYPRMHADIGQLRDVPRCARQPELSEANLIEFCSGIFPSEATLDLLVNEARFALSRVLPIVLSRRSDKLALLEVGAGSCILAAYLASRGLQVTAVEPLGPEFDFFTDVQRRVLDFCRDKGIAFNLVRTTGEQLDMPEQFDIAFTFNALEHMRDPMLTLDNMCRSLKPGGIVLACCPNYTIPFEAHFKMVLITRSKRLNERLYRSRIARHPRVWDELNFICYADIRRHLAKRGVNFTFNRFVMRDFVIRLLRDPIFARRMPLLVRAVGAGLSHCGLLNALCLIPLRFQTPLEVLIKRRDSEPA